MLPQCFRLRRSRRSGRAAAERSRNAPGSAAWVAPFTFFTQKPADYEEALFGARAAKTQEEKKELLKTAARLFSHDYALVVATMTRIFHMREVLKFLNKHFLEKANTML